MRFIASPLAGRALVLPTLEFWTCDDPSVCTTRHARCKGDYAGRGLGGSGRLKMAKRRDGAKRVDLDCKEVRRSVRAHAFLACHALDVGFA